MNKPTKLGRPITQNPVCGVDGCNRLRRRTASGNLYAYCETHMKWQNKFHRTFAGLRSADEVQGVVKKEKDNFKMVKSLAELRLRQINNNEAPIFTGLKLGGKDGK